MRDILGQLKSIDLKSIDLKAIDLKSVDIAGVDKKRVGTAVATLAIALGAGFYMQQEPGNTSGPQTLTPVPVQTASVLPTAAPETPTDVTPGQPTNVGAAVDLSVDGDMAPDATPTPAIATAPQITEDVTMDQPAAAQMADVTPSEPPVDLSADESFDLAALDLVPVAPTPSSTEAPMASTQCAPTLTGSAGKMAMISLTVSAPCHANQEIEFSHEGLRFTERLDGQGGLSLDLPALASEAKIVAHLQDDTSSVIEVAVPDAVQYRRVALIWHGATGLQLHAFEEGADYGDTGHVWAEQPGDLSRVEAGIGGYTTMLGSVSSGYAADIYSFPAYLMRSLSGPEITIEAQVMETTCGKALEATYLRTNGKKVITQTPIEIASPGCDAVGEYLVLQDLPETMRLALN
ncbi:hypothetical protein [Aliiroseovarius crassostreae]|uniref:hypothetical protein n=1 Tax=Aliiroseovarius crassostreae TaxID=154981 RepID=UPI003C7E8B11